MATVKLPTSVSSALNSIVDGLVGDLLDNPRVHRFVSWALMAAGAIFHGSLGNDISVLLVAAGGLGHAAQSVKTTGTPPPAA